MVPIRIDKGILTGIDLEVWDDARLSAFAQSEAPAELRRVSFFDKELQRSVFRGVNFIQCSFARSRFVSVTFRRCTFTSVDFTRVRFIDCHFSDCTFKGCDPYKPQFIRTVVQPSAFKSCYGSKDYNKALILFSALRFGFEKAGDLRLARASEYFYRVWQRRRLYHLWYDRQTSSLAPLLWSLFVGSLTGYGERPGYLGAWMFGLITVMSFVYERWFPCVVPVTNKFGAYWYFSFKVFCAQGFAAEYLNARLLSWQVFEFALGLVFISMLVGSITRKLS